MVMQTMNQSAAAAKHYQWMRLREVDAGLDEAPRSQRVVDVLIEVPVTLLVGERVEGMVRGVNSTRILICIRTGYRARHILDETCLISRR